MDRWLRELTWPWEQAILTEMNSKLIQPFFRNWVGGTTFRLKLPIHGFDWLHRFFLPYLVLFLVTQLARIVNTHNIYKELTWRKDCCTKGSPCQWWWWRFGTCTDTLSRCIDSVNDLLNEMSCNWKGKKKLKIRIKQKTENSQLFTVVKNKKTEKWSRMHIHLPFLSNPCISVWFYYYELLLFLKKLKWHKFTYICTANKCKWTEPNWTDSEGIIR